jgi:hypothetical protein
VLLGGARLRRQPLAVWTMNNWKPLFEVDANPKGNPGGDGIVIFVGLGAPSRAPRNADEPARR